MTVSLLQCDTDSSFSSASLSGPVSNRTESKSLESWLLCTFVKWCYNTLSSNRLFQGKQYLIVCLYNWLIIWESEWEDLIDRWIADRRHVAGLSCCWAPPSFVSTSMLAGRQDFSESRLSSALLPLFPRVSTAWLGDGRGQATLIHFLPPSQGSNWKIWVALLVCFGGMWWVVFFEACPQCRCSMDFRGESSDGGQAEPCLWSGTSLSTPVCSLQSAPPGSLPPADRLAGPLVFTVWFLWPSQTWTDRGALSWENRSQHSSMRQAQY